MNRNRNFSVRRRALHYLRSEVYILLYALEEVFRDFYGFIEQLAATRLLRRVFLRGEDVPYPVGHFAWQSLNPDTVSRIAGDLDLVAVNVDLFRLFGLCLPPGFTVLVRRVLLFASHGGGTPSFSITGRRRLLSPALSLELRSDQRLALSVMIRVSRAKLALAARLLAVFASLGLPLDGRLSVPSEVVVGAVEGLFSRLFPGDSLCWSSGDTMVCSAGAVTVTSAHCGTGRFLTSAIARLLYGRRLKPATVVVGTVEAVRTGMAASCCLGRVPGRGLISAAVAVAAHGPGCGVTLHAAPIVTRPLDRWLIMPGTVVIGTVEALRWLLRSAAILFAGRVFGRAGAVGFGGLRVVIASRGVVQVGRSIGAHC